MPLNLRDVIAGARNDGQTVNPPSIAEAEDLLAQARAAEAHAEAVRAAQAAELAEARAEAGKRAAALAKDAERRWRTALSEARKAAESAPVVGHPVRGLARGWLWGSVDTIGRLTALDEPLRILWAALEQTQLAIASCVDFERAPTPLGAEHPEIQKLDQVECALWSAVKARVRELAGE